MSFYPHDTDGYQWATYIPWRVPRFKLHAKKGHSINAVKIHSKHGKARITSESIKIFIRDIHGTWTEMKLKKQFGKGEDIFDKEQT